MRRLAVVGVLVAALAAGVACGGKDEPLVPTATVPQGTTTTNPYAVPPVIDESYVNRVLAGLNKGVGDITRMIVSSRSIPPEAVERLKAFYLGRALQLQIDGFQGDTLEGFRDYREVPGNQVTTVMEIIDVKPVCIFARVSIDFSAVNVQPNPSPSTQWIVLLPLDPANDLLRYNPTGWTYLFEGFGPDRSAPPNVCAAA